jgi:hypothetical protein
VTRLEETRQRAVDSAREEATVAKERVRVVESLERAVRGEAALVYPPLLELRKRRDGVSIPGAVPPLRLTRVRGVSSD